MFSAPWEGQDVDGFIEWSENFSKPLDGLESKKKDFITGVFALFDPS